MNSLQSLPRECHVSSRGGSTYAYLSCIEHAKEQLRIVFSVKPPDPSLRFSFQPVCLKEDHITGGRHLSLQPQDSASTNELHSTNTLLNQRCAYELNFRCNNTAHVQACNRSQARGLRRLLIFQTAPAALGCQRDDLAVISKHRLKYGVSRSGCMRRQQCSAVQWKYACSGWLKPKSPVDAHSTAATPDSPQPTFISLVRLWSFKCPLAPP